MENIVNDFVQALLCLNRLAAKQILDDHMGDALPITCIEEVVVVALDRIGTGWQAGTVALSQVYMAGRICEDLVDEMLPPGDPDRKNQPRLAICVLSDHHQLGKIIVYSMLRAGGFEVTDFGVVDVDDLVDRVATEKIEILLISVLMFPSALKVKQVKQRLADLGLDVKIIVGGAPFRFDDRLWKAVGADAMCGTASEAIPVIEGFMGGVA